MNVRFKMTEKGEVAILPRGDYEALAAKAREADENVGTARLVMRAREEIAAGMPLIPKANPQSITHSRIRALYQRLISGREMLIADYAPPGRAQRVCVPTPAHG